MCPPTRTQRFLQSSILSTPKIPNPPTRSLPLLLRDLGHSPFSLLCCQTSLFSRKIKNTVSGKIKKKRKNTKTLSGGLGNMRRRAADFRRPVRRRVQDVVWWTLCSVVVLFFIYILTTKGTSTASTPHFSRVTKIYPFLSLLILSLLLLLLLFVFCQ